MTSEDLPHRVRPSNEPIRFYFDESALGIGRVVAGARGDSIFPGHPRSPIKPGALDVDWVPLVAAEGWAVVLRDKRLPRRPAELAALASYPLRVLVMTSAGQLHVWEQLRVLLRYWDRVEEMMEQDAPWLATVTRNGIRPKSYPT